MKAIALALACLVAGLAAGRWWGGRSAEPQSNLYEQTALSGLCRSIGEALLRAAEVQTDMPPMYLRGVAVVGNVATVDCMDRVDGLVKRDPDARVSFSRELEAAMSGGVLADEVTARAALSRAGRMLVEGSGVLLSAELKAAERP